LKQFRPDVPDLLEAVCRRCLHKTPAERYQSAAELADVLRGFPRAPQANVQVLLLNQANGERFRLTEKCTVVGRSSGCDLKVNGPEISRRHCQITVANNVTIEDLGSAQGTRVNGRSITGPLVLCHGDVIDIAGLRFTIHLEMQ
jgi:pSer/pThr/pTyr-binding forkhead associated (FHA) protein